MRYPTYSELIFINGKIHNDKAIMTGQQKVRDIDLLLAAAERPKASAFGQDAYPTLKEKAVALLHSITRNHPFKDGNKRTGTIGALFMLAINGERVTWEPTEALSMILNLAEGHADLAEMTTWLTTETTEETALEADITYDTILIEQLIAEQKWLLDELAER